VTKLATRTLLVIVLVPILFALILAMPWYHHLVIDLVCVLFSVLGAYETSNFFAVRGYPSTPALTPVLGGMLPAAAYLEVAGLLPGGALIGFMVLGVSLILLREVFHTGTSEFADILPRIGVGVTVLVYPGLFLSYVVRFSGLALPAASLIIYLVIVFANDILAYLIGSAWGKTSRGILPISPNKSLIGFIGGLAGAIVIALVSWIVVPDVFGGSAALALFVGLGVGVLTILGDLIESAMKRSASLKDSGTLMPGRGGILDSIDSILFAAPCCFYLLSAWGGK
jgi:phosphatidate cytidylyltransferase